MRILYYFPELYTQMFTWQRIHIFDELQAHGVQVDAFNPLIYNSYDEANEALIQTASSNNYDMFLASICSEKMLYYQTLDKLKSMGLPTVSFRPDNLTIPFNDKNLAPKFDLLWLTSKETQHLYDKWHVKTLFLPYAANPFAFKYTQVPLIRKACFNGTPYGSRSLMINKLADSGIPVDVYCKSNPCMTKNDEGTKAQTKLKVLLQSPRETLINDLKYHEGRKILLGALLNKVSRPTSLTEKDSLKLLPFVSFNDLSANYSKYTLCLSSTSNRNTDVLRNPVKIINLRAFEIPMSGGITLCKYNPELAEYFEDGKEIIFYHDNQELVEKARYYIENASDEEILQIKQAARYRAENEHTWWNRFSMLFKELGLKYE